MEPIVETATIEDVEPRAQLRVALWPQDSLEDHRAELVRSLLSGHGQAVAFIARNDANETYRVCSGHVARRVLPEIATV